MTITSLSNPFRRPVTTILALMLFIGAAIGVRAYVSRNSRPASSMGQQQLTTAEGSVQMVRFTVYNEGLFPREARSTPGFVSIHIEDMSGNSAGLVVVRPTGEVIGQIVRGERQWRGRDRMLLAPGRYEVHDATRPANRAILIVEP